MEFRLYNVSYSRKTEIPALCSAHIAANNNHGLRGRTSGRHGDWLCQWEILIFALSHRIDIPQQIAKKLARVTTFVPPTLYEIWCRSVNGVLVAKWVKYNHNFFTDR